MLWFHLDVEDFSLQNVGVAISNSINGEYKWVGGFQPDGYGSLDMTLFQDKELDDIANYFGYVWQNNQNNECLCDKLIC